MSHSILTVPKFSSTSTTTPVTTKTTTLQWNVCTSAFAAPRACSNQGVEYAVFPNTAGPDPEDHLYSLFDPTACKTQTPLQSGTIDNIGDLDDSSTGSTISIYGGTPIPRTYFVVVQRGYLYASESGTYSWNFGPVNDDATFLWLGTPAQTGFTRGNANMIVSGPDAEGHYVTHTTQGIYIAYRFVYVQADGYCGFHPSVTLPDGSVLDLTSSKGSPYLVQYSCPDAQASYAAPSAWAAWGQES